MKRRNFIQALLGTAAIAPLLPLLGRETPVQGSIHMLGTGKSLYFPKPYDFSGMQYHVNNSGTYQGLNRATYIELTYARTDRGYELRQEVVTR